MKGIDRLLHGVAHAKREAGRLPFRVFLCGPDYRNGEAQAVALISKLGLESDILLLRPGSYVPGSKAPLRDADASVLLSRWDGWPRAIRESLGLGVPVLASAETHCTELLEASGAGVGIDDADDPELVGAGLLELAAWRERSETPQRARSAQRTLHADAVGRSGLEQLGAMIG